MNFDLDVSILAVVSDHFGGTCRPVAPVCVCVF